MHLCSPSPSFYKVLVAVVIATLTGIGCTIALGDPVPTFLPNVPTWDLMLDDHPFPEGWIVFPCLSESTCARQYRDAKSDRDFGRVGIPGHVTQQVFRFDSVKTAQAKFQRVREADFRPRQPPNMQFAPLPEITYRSPIADEYHLGCGVDEVPACKAIFRYSQYYVEFYFSLDHYQGHGIDYEGDGLKLEEVEPILRAMDARAAAVFGLRPKSMPTKSP